VRAVKFSAIVGFQIALVLPLALIPGPCSAASASPTHVGLTQNQVQHAYLCTARHADDRSPEFYRTDVFQTTAATNPGAVMAAWKRYLVRTYPDRFRSDRSSGEECTRTYPNEPAEAYAQQYKSLEASARARNAKIIRVEWKYTPDQAEPAPPRAAGRAPSQMPAPVRQLIEDEATRRVADICNENNTNARIFNPQKPAGSPLQDIYDCSCYEQKVREYRLREYEERGDGMVINNPRLGPQLDPPLAIVLLTYQGSTVVDLTSCAVGEGGAPRQPDVRSPAPATQAAAPPAPAPAAKAVELLAYCFTGESAQHVIYFSPIVAANATATDRGGSSARAPDYNVRSAFRTFLLTKYGVRMSVGCNTSVDSGGAQGLVRGRQEQIDICRHRGLTIIEPDWKYTPDQGVAPPASSSAVAASPAASVSQSTPARTAALPLTAVVPRSNKVYGVCTVDLDMHVAYYNAPFETTTVDTNAWRKGYGDFLKTTYGYRGGNSARCWSYTSLEQAQASLAQRKTLKGGLNTRTKLDTSWKFK
jgi:hypothetical protein